MKNIWKSFVAMAVLSLVLCPVAWGETLYGTHQSNIPETYNLADDGVGLEGRGAWTPLGPPNPAAANIYTYANAELNFDFSSAPLVPTSITMYGGTMNAGVNSLDPKDLNISTPIMLSRFAADAEYFFSISNDKQFNVNSFTQGSEASSTNKASLTGSGTFNIGLINTSDISFAVTANDFIVSGSTSVQNITIGDNVTDPGNPVSSNTNFKGGLSTTSLDLQSGAALFGSQATVTNELKMGAGTTLNLGSNNVAGGADATIADGATIAFAITSGKNIPTLTFDDLTLGAVTLDITNGYLEKMDTLKLIEFGALFESVNLMAATGSDKTFKVLNDSGDIVDFTLSDVVFNWTDAINGSYVNWYVTRDGNNLNLYGVSVPEPSTYAMFLLGMAGLAVYRRRVMKKK